MTETIRRRLRAIVAAVWIGGRVVALVATPLAMWTSAADAAVECHCTHGADATCPMHHKPASGTRLCAMQAAGDWTTAALESILGLAAPHERQVAVAEWCEVSRVDAIATAPASLPCVPPEPPPPRA